MYAKNLKRDLTAIIILITVFAAHAAAVTVSVDAPEYESGTDFDVKIKIDHVDDLESGQFDISFNSSVVNVTKVSSGSINGTVLVADWAVLLDPDSWDCVKHVRVLFDVPDVTGVSGEGLLATIEFEVVGKHGDTSFLNFTDIYAPLLLADKDSDKIPADWVSHMVTLGRPPVGTNPTVTVYVKNLDDDKLDIHLLVDGNDEGFESISSGNTKEYDDYRMEEGAHTFTIRWFDTDTDEWYEKTEERKITFATTITLLIDEHAEDKISAHVYIKNLDDDDPNVYLYIDGNYEKYMSISSNSTGDYGEYEFEDGDDALHSFRVEWFDPGTGEDYEKITRIYVTSEEAVTLYIDKHTKGDIILLPDETPTSVSTRTPTATTSLAARDSQPPTRNTPSNTAFHTDPTLSENSAGNNGLGQGTTWYTLIGLIAAVFALLQIRRG